MSEEQQLKEQCIRMAAADLEKLLSIIGDLGYLGYKICRCKLKGYSYNQCKGKLRVSRSLVQWHWKKCKRLGYDVELRRILNLPNKENFVKSV